MKISVPLAAKHWNTRGAAAAYLLLAAIYLYLTLFKLPATPIFFENDHFLQMYDSVRMLSGEVMYRDFFQFTFPGTEIWYAAAFFIFGEKLWLLNATVLLLGLGLTWTVLAISKRMMTGAYVYIAPSIVLFFGFRWYGLDGGHRPFSCLFAMLAILTLIERTSWQRLVVAAMFSALAAMFTQTRGIAMFGAVGVFLLWEFFPGRRLEGVSQLFKLGTIFTFAFGGFLALFLVYFLATAGAAEFFRSTIGFAANYSADPVNNSNLYMQFWKSLTDGTFNRASLPVDLFYYILVPAVYIVPLAYYAIRRNGEARARRQIILLAICGLFLFLATTGLSSVRLYHVALPGVVIVSYGLSRTSAKAVPLYAGLLVIAAAFALAGWNQVRTYPPAAELPTGRVLFTSDLAAERYLWVNEHTEPGDLVFEPYRTMVNFPLKVKNPTSFALLRNNNYTTAEQVSIIVEQLNTNPPKYILWNGAWSVEPRSPDDHLGPLYAYLIGEYFLEKRLTPMFDTQIEAWRRRDDR